MTLNGMTQKTTHICCNFENLIRRLVLFQNGQKANCCLKYGSKHIIIVFLISQKDHQLNMYYREMGKRFTAATRHATILAAVIANNFDKTDFL